MLTFAAITPHPPILVPTIGKENLEQIKATVEAMVKLEKIFSDSQPEVALIISPHGPLLAEAFTINVNERYLGDFEAFGDFSAKLSFRPEPELIDKIKNCGWPAARLPARQGEAGSPVILTTQPKLDHGALVPLYYLTKNLSNIRIIPVSYSLLDFKTHLAFGQQLKKIIDQSQKRIAVVASGDLSHCLTPDAPGGYSERGKEFDEKLIELLLKKDVDGIKNLDPNLIDQAGECGLRSIMILLGILKDTDYQPEKLSYEGPFGVGYLVMNFKL